MSTGESTTGLSDEPDSLALDERRRQRLRWRCRRGMRELDAAMLSWLDHYYPSASEAERQQFEELLDKQDPELFALLLGKIREDRHARLLSQIGEQLQGRP